MPLATAIVTVIGLDLAVLAALAYVMRAPFRLAARAEEPAAVAERSQAAGTARRRSAPSRVRPQAAAGAAR